MQEEALASGGFALAWLVKVSFPNPAVWTVTMLLEKGSCFLRVTCIKMNMHVYVGLRKRARNARAADMGEAFTIQRLNMLKARLDMRVTGPCVDQALLLALEVARPL